VPHQAPPAKQTSIPVQKAPVAAHVIAEIERQKEAPEKIENFS